ncbi:response regulator transcription factor [Methylotuvimicrobium buryatense]|uniref:Response regulator transcription factor n=1 Tax=Methylotuvimicrobium buryatense TaxID=95641 RepID=A0A4P9USC9_METBY|nr:response regulator transcription factor [Methylotuvimicrobium buryatense]QCW82626.1 response regulator transcription factor [Methylotuvimicrobium buryatense]
MVKIILADDHAILRSGLKEILNIAPDIQLIGEAEDGEELLCLLNKHVPNILMTDMSMPGINGLALIGRIRKYYPELPILVLSMLDDLQLVMRAVNAGIQGYVTKSCSPEILLEAINKVASGGKYIEPRLAERALFSGKAEKSPLEQLSKREHEIFMLLVQGMDAMTIAGRLFISVKTVSTHKSHILEKMDMKNVAELVRYAMQNQLL